MQARSDTIGLNYLHPPARWRRRRWQIVGLLLLAGVGVALGGRRWGPAISRQARILYWQAQCMKYSAPADKALAPPLPHCYCSLYAASERRNYPRWDDQMMLFMHERTSPAGNRRLVVMYGSLRRDVHELPAGVKPWMPKNVQPSSWKIPVPLVYVYDPATLSTDLREVYHVSVGFDEWGVYGLAESVQFEIFPGQPDSHDPSHFTIRFQADDKTGAIEGWLRDDNTIKFKVTGAPGWAYDLPAE